MYIATETTEATDTKASATPTQVRQAKLPFQVSISHMSTVSNWLSLRPLLPATMR